MLGPAGLKIGSTLWRFTRYYTGSAAYVRKGPPAPLQRVTGPFVILTTAAVLAPLPGSGGRWDWSGLVLDADPAQVPRGPAIVLGWLWEE